MDVKQLQILSNEMATEKGWWDELNGEEPLTTYLFATKLSLIGCEVSEAIEDLRADDWAHLGEELADIAIRLADFAEQCDIDLTKEIERKMAINANRPHRHGKTF